jgi:hypothetical protein
VTTARNAIAADDAGKDDPGQHPNADALSKLANELNGRLSQGAAAGEHSAGKRQREHRAGGVVESRLGDHSLHHLGAQRCADKQRNQDCRVRGREHGSDQQR